MDNYFQPFNSIEEVQEELNLAIENQTAAIFNTGDNSINLTFYLKNEMENATINLKLIKEKIESQQQK